MKSEKMTHLKLQTSTEKKNLTNVSIGSNFPFSVNRVNNQTDSLPFKSKSTVVTLVPKSKIISFSRAKSPSLAS